MSKTVQLPGDATAVIRDPDELTERQRRVMRTALLGAFGDSLASIDLDNPAADMKIKVTPELGAVMFQMRDASITAGLVAWSLPEPLPTLETVQDLPAPLYDALADACASLATGMTLDTSPNPDPASPTQPSSASDGLLRVAEQPTVTLSTSGANTGTGNSFI